METISITDNEPVPTVSFSIEGAQTGTILEEGSTSVIVTVTADVARDHHEPLYTFRFTTVGASDDGRMNTLMISRLPDFPGSNHPFYHFEHACRGYHGQLYGTCCG